MREETSEALRLSRGQPQIRQAQETERNVTAQGGVTMIEELGAILQFLFIRDGVAVNDLVRTLIFLVFDGIVAVAAIITVKRTKHHEEGIEHGD